MLTRSSPAHRSLSLPRLSLRRPQSVARHPCLPSFHTSTRRLLTARVDLPPRRRKIPQDTYGSAPIFQRSLATAIGDPIRQDDIPFEHMPSHMPNSFMQPLPHPRLYDIRPFDSSSLLQIKALDDAPPRMRMNVNGIPGGVDEMMSVFDACIQVGKLDRAALVLSRLSDAAVLSPHEMVALHNQYLRAYLNRAFEQPDVEWARSIHKWYELHIRGKDLPQTSETIACMLKVSLLSARGVRLERLVTRYLDMMPGDAMYQVLSEMDILSQQDFGTIASIYQPASDLFEEFDFSPEEQSSSSVAPATSTSPSEPKKSERDESPEVLSVPQKGLGLQSLRSVLTFFSKVKGEDVSRLTIPERREIQARMEQDCVDAAINRWREENEALKKMGLNAALSTHALNSQLYEWQHALETRLEKEFALFEKSESRDKKTAEDHDRCITAPFLSQSTPSRLAAVTIICVLNSISSTGVDSGIQLSTLLNQLSKGVEDDIKVLIRQRQSPPKFKRGKRIRQPKVAKQQDGSVSSPAESPSAEADAKPKTVEPAAFQTKAWPLLIRTKVGAVLLSALMDTAKVEMVREHPETKALVSQRQPALSHTTMHRRGKKVGLVMPNKFLVELLKREPPADFLARHLPMLSEPEPWTKFDKGGFLEFPAQLIRVKYGEKDQRIYAEAAMQRGDLEQVSKGLDVLGRTGWRINGPVFDVILDAWNSGERVANIPPLHPNIPTPVEPEASDNPLQRREWFRALRAAENLKSGLHSERCFMNLQLEIARAFRDQTFYFPHNMDFRGRAYPIPTYLNHMGADHVRGLLRFAKGKELGESGLRWLKIHLANVFGYDKASLKEREAFMLDHIDEVYDSATSPLTGKRWWLKAEDPWQCLATCFELKAALDSPDPTKYVSHLPVHQDGTCNGLQHYAALGGDLWGAQQVNLEPGDRPADVYSAVAELVKRGIAEDMEADNFLAKAVDGKITRKVVKQTVMTNVYGVTFTGAKAQVLKQLDAAYPNFHQDTDVPAAIAASYIATKIFKGLSSMFRGAHDIQYWFGECAGRVCRALTPEQIERIAQGGEEIPKPLKSNSRKQPKTATDHLLTHFRSTVVWTTPLRMPIVQPYRKTGVRVIATSLQDLSLQVPERSDPVNRRKQLQAFPPNFIHSLDASHMLLSALECDELGLSFAAVHDSFWTHASDIDVMNRVLRDCFIRIHSEDVIGRLLSEFQARYKGALYLAKVDRGSAVEKKITKLRKDKKRTLTEELVHEYERVRLLSSADPKDVKKGKKMVTPASIFEEMSATQPYSSADEMEALGLGNIPNAEAEAKVIDDLEGDGEDDDFSTPAGLDDIEGELGFSNPEHFKALMDVSRFESEITGAAKAKAKKPTNLGSLNIWLPLNFPDVPAKGDFDVARLKESKYFFS
ncbi:DNA/RNA polymerase [Jackrogersella minutella]|nr:DNA/RNA polymerase [Jackrogersella minutella]